MAEKILAETRAKVPVFEKAIPFANRIGSELIVLLVVVVIACSGGKKDSGGGGAASGRAAPASDFTYDLTGQNYAVIKTQAINSALRRGLSQHETPRRQ
jgi:hypothetical protein